MPAHVSWHHRPTLHRRARRPGRAGQQGMVLVLTLLFTLAVLILSASAARTVISAERMSGNLRNQNLSFEAAQAALLAAETHLNDNPILTDTAAGVAGTGTGDYGAGSTRLTVNGDPGQSSFWRNFAWNGTNATPVTVTVNGTTRTAYYTIETLPAPALVNGSTARQAFRVTAYAQGGNSEAVTLLQSTYTR